MLPQKTVTPSLNFLSGGGKMGELVRTMDWSQTSVGDPSAWPQSLRTSVSICLNSSSPLLIWWGKDLVKIYNDAYCDLIATKHPTPMGATGANVWPEILPNVSPMLKGILKDGEATGLADQLLVIERDGRSEVCYFTFSYSAIRDEAGNVGGIFCAVTETTKKVNAEKKLSTLLNNLFVQAPVGICVFRGENYIVEVVNKMMLEFVGRTQIEVLNKPVFEALPEVREQGFKELLDTVYKTGERFVAEELPVNLMRRGKMENAFVKFIYEPLREEDGTISGIMAVAHEITEQVLARKKAEENEHRYQEMIFSSPSLIAILKGEEMIIDIANDAILETWGKGKNVVGKPLLTALPELVGNGFDDLFHNVYTSGKPHFAYEMPVYFVRNGQKELSYYTFIYQAQRDIGGNINGVAVIGREVTPEAQLNQKIKESEERFRQMADLMPAKISNANADGSVTYFNKNWKEFTGMSFEDFRDFGYHKIMHPDELEEFQKRLTNAAETGSDFEMEMRFLNKEGEYMWNLNRASPVKDENGNVKMWIGVTSDIQKIKEEERQKDNFLSMASHELKTPVTTIKAYGQIAEMMLQENGDKETLAIVSRMGSQVNKLNTLIGELLDFTKIQQGKLIFNEDFFEFNEFMKEVVEDMRHTTITHKISYSQSADARIYGDKVKLSQVVNNLVSNGIKYSPGANKILITTQLQNDGITLSIKDYGIGIAKEAQDKVFEQFYRVSGDSHSTYPGMGIGLYICAEIIKREGGRIWVESSSDEGSVFCVWLPFDHRDQN
jgi:PAS domain S-box-containing protein